MVSLINDKYFSHRIESPKTTQMFHCLTNNVTQNRL